MLYTALFDDVVFSAAIATKDYALILVAMLREL